MVITKKDFCMYVEDDYASTNKTIIESILLACERYSIDPDLIEPLINRSLKEKLRREFINLNYMKLENTVII